MSGRQFIKAKEILLLADGPIIGPTPLRQLMSVPTDDNEWSPIINALHVSTTAAPVNIPIDGALDIPLVNLVTRYPIRASQISQFPGYHLPTFVILPPVPATSIVYAYGGLGGSTEIARPGSFILRIEVAFSTAAPNLAAILPSPATPDLAPRIRANIQFSEHISNGMGGFQLVPAWNNTYLHETTIDAANGTLFYDTYVLTGLLNNRDNPGVNNIVARAITANFTNHSAATVTCNILQSFLYINYI